MRYLDSGSRDLTQAVGTWLQNALTPDVIELRWQSGFFASDAVALFATTLGALAGSDRTTRVLIGANDPGLSSVDVRALVMLLGLPRQNAHLGVVSYENAFYHPKTYHIRRADGTQCAYVGSANLTPPGITGQHVEAGLVLDTRDGDPEHILNQIAAAVDVWFVEPRAGFIRITDSSEIDGLVTSGLLLSQAIPRSQPSSGGGGRVATAKPRLRPLMTLPTLPAQPTAVDAPSPPLNVSAPKVGFPAYLLFAPDSSSPTSGIHALTGSALPGGACGLVIRLNRDNARYFEDRGGTANISIPVATVSTIRFGIFRKRYVRPRAEFDLHLRYIGQTTTISSDVTTTNVMAYGFAQGETGHRDIRMVMPTSVRALRDEIRSLGLPVPAKDDMALLEWPTPTDPSFRMTFLDQTAPVGQHARELFSRAAASKQSVGNGACWLLPGVSPEWGENDQSTEPATL
jgi:hypothetical protein